MAGDRCAGFGHHKVKARVDAPARAPRPDGGVSAGMMPPKANQHFSAAPNPVSITMAVGALL